MSTPLYDNFLKTILSKPKLVEQSQLMADGNSYLNLVDVNWQNTLTSSEIFKKHSAFSVKFSKGKQTDKSYHVRNIIGMDNYYNVVVAGIWTLENKPELNNITISCKYCMPLVSIGQSMKEHNKQSLSDNCRFFIEKCDVMLCADCKEFKKGYDLKANEWCVRSIKVFDGSCVKNLLKSHVESAFGTNSFMGILRLSVMSRYTFGDNCFKIGGLCKEMLLFKESVLHPVSQINFATMETTIPAVAQAETSKKEEMPKKEDVAK